MTHKPLTVLKLPRSPPGAGRTFSALHPAPTIHASLESWAPLLLAPFAEPLSANSTRCSSDWPFLVPVLALLGSHHQGKAVQSSRRQAESCASRIPSDREETAFLRQA
jgi:hypothetical protein